MAKQKYYVVWKGHKTGIFTSWAECEKQVKGFVDAKYKAFESEAEAESAFLASYDDYKGKVASHGRWKTASVRPILPSICVDAACSGSPGKLEYRGVITETGEQIYVDTHDPNFRARFEEITRKREASLNASSFSPWITMIGFSNTSFTLPSRK